MKSIDRRSCLMLTLGLILPACSGPPDRQGPSLKGRSSAVDRPNPATLTDLGKLAEAIVDLHNEEREKAGLADLEVDPRLKSAAIQHARDMARRGRMSHRGADFSTPFDRIERAGYRFRNAAENVAAGQTTPEEVMKGWMGSPGHRKNILGNSSQIGTACAIEGSGTFFWCVTFGTPVPA